MLEQVIGVPNLEPARLVGRHRGLRSLLAALEWLRTLATVAVTAALVLAVIVAIMRAW